MPATRRAPTKRRRAARPGKVSKAVKKYVKRSLPKTEMHMTFLHLNEIQLSTFTQGYSVSGPVTAKGDGTSDRTGNIINACGLHYKGVVYNNSGSETMVRMIIVGSRASDGDPKNILFRADAAGVVAGISGINGLDAMYFPLNKVDLHVYHDKIIRLAGSVTGNAGANVKLFNKFVKLNRRKIEYKTLSSVTSADWVYTAMWIAADSNDDTTTGTSVELSCLERFYSQDS
jgi:hypothetical protein